MDSTDMRNAHSGMVDSHNGGCSSAVHCDVPRYAGVVDEGQLHDILYIC